MKLGNLQQITEIINPLLEEKCPVHLSLEILDLINEIQPHLEKVAKVKENIINQYMVKDEDGNVKTKMQNGNEVYDFEENNEKVNNEMITLMETEVEINSKIDIDNFDNDARIEPIKLKILYDLGVLTK